MDLNYEALLFWVLAGLTGLCAILVVVTQNIVRSATYLLFTLGGTSGIFFLLGADFVAATQLLVYVGGTLVLVVFGVMLTAQGPFINLKTGPAEWALALVVGLLLYGALAVAIVVYHSDPRGETAPTTPGESMTSAVLGEALLGVKETAPDHRLTGFPEGQKPPRRSKVGYLLPFEIVSVHLLVVLIGAAYLARAKRRRGTVP